MRLSKRERAAAGPFRMTRWPRGPIQTRMCHPRCRGFTLIELLVVISIIALMMSISLPALTQAQKQAEAVHCLANERELTLAWMLYAMDNEDRLCDPNSFTSLLEPYVQMSGVYVCKAVEDERAGNSYGLSNTMAGEERDGVTPYEKLHKIARAGEKMVFTDAEVGYARLVCFWPVLQHEGTWKWRPWSWPPGFSLQAMTARHHEGCNMSFADGHSEYYRWKDHRTVKLIKGKIADPNDASSDNVDLDYMVRILTR
jgi:prepilin-type N-terminal cleavage/methylation domain-containing protein/prepilin-type processing-associated H-X9-DG protein